MLTLAQFAHIEHNTAHRVTPSTVSFGFHSIWKVLFPHQNVINECLLCTQPHIMSLLLDGGSNLDIVYILYQIIYLCHLAPLSWATLRQDSVCSFYLFVITFFVTLGVIPPCQKSWEQKNKIKVKKNWKTTPFFIFKKFHLK